jgi:hypothetical protein
MTHKKQEPLILAIDSSYDNFRNFLRISNLPYTGFKYIGNDPALGIRGHANCQIWVTGYCPDKLVEISEYCIVNNITFYKQELE